MTEFEHFMLSFCFSSMTGYLVGELIVIVVFTVSTVKDKIRKRKKKSANPEK